MDSLEFCISIDTKIDLVFSGNNNNCCISEIEK